MKICIFTAEEFFAHPDAEALLAAYAAECANPRLPPPKPNRQLYMMLQSAGFLHILAACDGAALLGFMTLLINENPHYSVKLATSESIFVLPEARNTGAGLKLINHAEGIAASQGAAGMFICAPRCSALDTVLRTKGCEHSNNVYMWPVR